MSELKKIEETLKSFLDHLEDQIKQIMAGSHDHATKNQQILDTVQLHSKALADQAAGSESEGGEADAPTAADTPPPAPETGTTGDQNPPADAPPVDTPPTDTPPADTPPTE